MNPVQSEFLNEILAKKSVLGRTERTYEDARIYDDIPKLFIKIHKYLIKPVSYWGSSRILRKQVLKAAGAAKGLTVIDVSAGDDSINIELAKQAKKLVANDIVDKTLNPLRLLSKKEKVRITFSNKNILKLDARKKFDLVLCKNTLHHLNTVRQMTSALFKLKQLTKPYGKLVIMDVENPALSLKARLWNAYYVLMLKDQGGFFINYDLFVDMLALVFVGYTIKTKKISTIKGDYMMAEIFKLPVRETLKIQL